MGRSSAESGFWQNRANDRRGFSRGSSQGKQDREVKRVVNNLQPEPFRQFFHADGEPLKLETRDFYD